MEILYDEAEKVHARHICLITDDQRYDFSIMYTEQFQGKSMVTCLQTGNMWLLSCEDLEMGNEWASRIRIFSKDVGILRTFFQNALSYQPLVPEA
ncbi:SAV0927 family protein [Paludifilum halophilum]|nr:SAV0927 family protein [Paludifilum halophilum]